MIPLNQNLSTLKRSAIRVYSNLARETEDCVMLTIGEPDFDTPEDAIPLFNRLMALSQDSARYVRCISKDKEAIGFLNDVESKDGRIELGYVIHPAFHGQGYMTEALKMAIGELFAMGYAEVICGAFTENAASIRVMEKAGMQRMEFTENIDYRGTTHLCVYYSTKKEDTEC